MSRMDAIEKEVGVHGRLYLQGVLNKMRNHYHDTSVEAGWWSQLEEIQSYLPEELRPTVEMWYLATKLCLVHSEVSEMMEGLRKGLSDDHLPHRSMEEVESADLLIRIFDYAGFRKLDLDGATYEKGEYNLNRPDHKIAEREGEGGKKF